MEIAPASQSPAAWPPSSAVAVSALAPSASSDVLSPIKRRAAGVAPMSTPSSPNTATGSTQAASSLDTRSLKRKIRTAALDCCDQHGR